MVVIIVSIVIIAIRGVLFQNSSTIFFFVFDGCDHCEHYDYCHKRGHFSK